MTMRLFGWALQQRAIPSDEKFVLMAMSEAASDSDNIWRGSIESICRFTNLEGTDVPEIINRLVDNGLLARVGPYLVLLAPAAEFSPASSKADNYFKKKPISKTTRLLVMHRDDHQCQQCGAEDDLTIDHIHPESKGGTNEIENLQVLCRRCNCSKGVKVPA